VSKEVNAFENLFIRKANRSVFWVLKQIKDSVLTKLRSIKIVYKIITDKKNNLKYNLIYNNIQHFGEESI
jgi:hypothetical protein